MDVTKIVRRKFACGVERSLTALSRAAIDRN
jgi:hypothetical protein